MAAAHEGLLLRPLPDGLLLHLNLTVSTSSNDLRHLEFFPRAIAELVLSNPARRNALTARAAVELADAVDALEAWTSRGCGSALVVRGDAGRGPGAKPFFCAGMDLGLAGSLPREAAVAICELMASTLRRLHGLRVMRSHRTRD